MSKEIISHFRDKPKTKITWWAFGLGILPLFSGPILGVMAAVVVPFIAKNTSEGVGSAIGFSVGILTLAITIAALICGTIAFRRGERSWVMWFGFIPAILAGCFWVFLIAGEFLFPH
jgi:cytochrome c biogenesis protein CcdA